MPHMHKIHWLGRNFANPQERFRKGQNSKFNPRAWFKKQFVFIIRHQNILQGWGVELGLLDLEAMLRSEVWKDVMCSGRKDPSVYEHSRTSRSFELRVRSWVTSPMAAAVISGVIISHLERESCILEPGRCIVGREEWNGWQVRRDPRIVSDSLKKWCDKVAWIENSPTLSPPSHPSSAAGPSFFCILYGYGTKHS
jgi:hypothetical protein